MHLHYDRCSISNYRGYLFRELVICGNTDVNQYTQRELASDLLSDVPVNCSAKLCSLELVHLEGLTFQLIDKIAQKCCNLSKLSIQVRCPTLCKKKVVNDSEFFAELFIVTKFGSSRQTPMVLCQDFNRPEPM